MPPEKSSELDWLKNLNRNWRLLQGRKQQAQPRPRTPLEAELLSIWQQVLENKQIGVQDDFLALGGNSIQAARILALVNEQFGIDLQLIDIFTTSTVATMANLVQENTSELENDYRTSLLPRPFNASI